MALRESIRAEIETLRDIPDQKSRLSQLGQDFESETEQLEAAHTARIVIQNEIESCTSELTQLEMLKRAITTKAFSDEHGMCSIA